MQRSAKVGIDFKPTAIAPTPNPRLFIAGDQADEKSMTRGASFYRPRKTLKTILFELAVSPDSLP
jgi:hypothetical protein